MQLKEEDTELDLSLSQLLQQRKGREESPKTILGQTIDS